MEKWELYFECRRSQELRHEILTKTLDVSGSRVGRRVFWRFSRSKRAIELHSQQNGTAIQINWSYCLQKDQCLESWSLEARVWKMYHSLQWRFYEYRTLVPSSSLCQSAQYLKSSSELVSSIRFDREKGRTNFPVDNKIILPSWSEKNWNCWYLFRPKHLETRCKEAYWTSKHLKRRYSSHNFAKKSLRPMSCGSREAVQSSTRWRRRMENNHSSTLGILELSNFSENPSLGSYSRRHNHWTNSARSCCKNSWRILLLLCCVFLGSLLSVVEC